MKQNNRSKYNFKIGDVIGYNTIIERIKSKYLCQCECGSLPRILEPYLILNKRRCANCGNSRPMHENPNFKGYAEMRGDIVKKLNRMNKQKGFIDTDLTPEYLWNLYISQNRRCAFSGIELFFSIPNTKFYDNFEKTVSLDRIDSSKGYFIGNVHWVHKDINRMKNKYDVEYFLYLCTAIATNTNRNIITVPTGSKFN
jgi:hypothetical protein